MADVEQDGVSPTHFNDLGLNDWLVKQCQVMGMKQPTPIQVNCLPEIIKGKIPAI